MAHEQRTLAEWRALRYLTQEELAYSAGIASSTVSKIERGRATPTLRTLHKLALALRIEPDQLALPSLTSPAPDPAPTRVWK